MNKLAREHTAKSSDVPTRGFSSGSPAAPKPTRPSLSTKHPTKSGTTREEGEEDLYSEQECNEKDQGDEDDEPGFEDEDNFDTNVLPTMLIYRCEDLIYNWVRVDREAGKAGVKELLTK